MTIEQIAKNYLDERNKYCDEKDIIPLYKQIRSAEGKLPDFFFEETIHSNSERAKLQNLEIKSEGNNIYFNDILLVTSTQQSLDYYTRMIFKMEEMNGEFFLSRHFFRRFDMSRNGKTTSSQSFNLAKGFFLVNGINHAMLVQYIPPNGATSRHYHTLEENIILLKGNAFIELCQKEDNKTVKDLTRILIPPECSHRIVASDEGCITFSVKATLGNQKDHFYPKKDEEDIERDINAILMRHSSGEDLDAEISEYLNSLNKHEFREAKKALLKRQNNLVAKRILEQIAHQF